MSNFDLNYDEILDWFDDNIFKCLTLGYWVIVIFGSIFYLIIDSNDSMKLICPISGIWSNLAFQTIVSIYGFCVVAFLNKEDCHDIINPTTKQKAKIIYYLDITNIVICVIALLYNAGSMSNTCNDKITHTNIYLMARANVTTITGFLLVSIVTVLHKRIIMTKAIDGTLRNPHNIIPFVIRSPGLPQNNYNKVSSNYGTHS